MNVWGLAVPRAWSKEETKQVLMEAAWLCLVDGANTGKVNLDIARVLDLASELWTQTHAGDRPRTFTRGAIINIWDTVGDFQRDCVLTKLNDRQREINANIKAFAGRLHQIKSLPAENRAYATREALATFGKRQLQLHASGPELTHYLRLLSRHGMPEVQERIHQMYSSEEKLALVAYDLTFKMMGLKLKEKAKDMAVMVTAIIEGAATRTVVDGSRLPAAFPDLIGQLVASVPEALARLNDPLAQTS